MDINDKPLLNSILTGTFYLLFSWSADLNEIFFAPYALLMQILPGITFPLMTTFPILNGESKLNRRLHLILSIAIYYGSVWIYSGHVHFKYISILAGFVGSIGYLIISRLLLRYPLSNKEIIIAGVVSGLTFLPFEIFGGFSMVGLAILLWTVTNGFFLNQKYKITPANIV